MHTVSLFDAVSPFRTLRLDADGGHQLHIELSGNPMGLPVVMLHGGPGSGLNPEHRRLFDPDKFLLVMFDQRGCGQSTPPRELQTNTTTHLVHDIDIIRTRLGIKSWHVAGGSWGSTLALAYASMFPEHIRSLTLYGIFLGRKRELEALYHKDGIASRLFPEAFSDFLRFLPSEDRDNPIDGYGKVFSGPPSKLRTQALIAWTRLEKLCSQITVDENAVAAQLADESYVLSHSLIENHYFRNDCFIDGDALLAEVGEVPAFIPVTLINGRYDIVTPPETAYELANTIPHAQLIIVDGAGHSVKEPGIRTAFMQAIAGL